MFVCEGAYRRDLWWPQVTEVCKTFTPKSLAPDSAAKGFLLHYCTATDSVGSFYFWVLTPFFLTSSRSSFIRSSKSYSFCLSSSFFLLTSKRFFTWSRDDRSTRMDMPRFLWSVGAHTHTHTKVRCVWQDQRRWCPVLTWTHVSFRWCDPGSWWSLWRRSHKRYSSNCRDKWSVRGGLIWDQLSFTTF